VSYHGLIVGDLIDADLVTPSRVSLASLRKK
jgi:hypothetical protein